MNQKVLSMLGLARKAGRIKSGEFSTERTVKDGRAFLVVVAEDASDNTKKLFRNMCSYYQVPCRFFGTKDQLGHAIGRQFCASLACTEEHFAEALMQRMEQNI